METRIQRILIVRTDRIGDVILTLPMAAALKRRLPSAAVAMLIQRYTRELVQGNPSVDTILFYDDGGRPVGFFRLVAELRNERFDVVFHTHPRFRLALMTWMAGIPIRVGTGYRWYSFLFNRKVYEHRKTASHHELEYNLHLLRGIGISVDEPALKPSVEVLPHIAQQIPGLLARHGLQSGTTLVIIHPGSGGSARDWPAAKFGDLARRLRELPSVSVVVTGGVHDRPVVDETIAHAGPGVASIVGELSLHELAALARHASLFIANSTGPIHIAAAVGTMVIGLYPQITALSAARWGPYTERRIIFMPEGKPAECTICTRQGHQPCECMDSIRVEDVYQAAVGFLAGEK